MEYNLIENAIHSLSEALNYYHEGDEEENADKYKFSILLVSHCAELLLKQILFSNHPSLILENIDKNYSEKPITVGYRNAIERVCRLCGVELNHYRKYLEDLGEIRNIIQHYKFTMDGNHFKKIITESFSAIEFLYLDVLKCSFDDYPQFLDKQDIEFLHEDTEIYKKRSADIIKEVNDRKLNKVKINYDSDKEMVIPCPICGFRFLIQENSIKCKMCSAEFKDLNNVYDTDRSCIVSNHILRELGRRLGKLTYPIYDCAVCDANALTYSLKYDRWTCINCGEDYGENCSCEECGQDMPYDSKVYSFLQSYYNSDDYFVICPNCAKDEQCKEKYMDYDFQ